WIVRASAPCSSSTTKVGGYPNMTEQTEVVDRRSVLLGAGTAAAAGVVAAFGASQAEAQGRVDQECMTIVYQNGADVRFDFDYYLGTHMPLIMRLYGKSI